MILNDYLLGEIEDNAVQLVPKEYLYLLGLEGSSKNLSSQPLTNDIFLLLNNYIKPTLLYNIFVITVFSLNIYFFYRFIKIFINDKSISVLLSIIFGIAPCIIYQSQSHTNLFPVFLIISR